MQILIANAGHVVGTERLLTHVWGHRGSGDRQLLKQLVRRLRQKIEADPAEPRYLQTEPGLSWTEKPLATRATSARGGRVTLHRDRLRVRDDELSIHDKVVPAEQWGAELRTWFEMTIPTAR